MIWLKKKSDFWKKQLNSWVQDKKIIYDLDAKLFPDITRNIIWQNVCSRQNLSKNIDINVKQNPEAMVKKM